MCDYRARKSPPPRGRRCPYGGSSSLVVHPASLAQAACSPACAAATDTATSATSATPDTASSTPADTASSAAPDTAATATSAAANNNGQLHAAASVFLIEDMERGEADVGHFLFAKNEALIGRDVVRFRDIGSGYRGCGCAPRQRETQSGRTECRYGGGFGCARVLRGLLHPWHGRILS
jgi:hypothetical protein